MSTLRGGKVWRRYRESTEGVAKSYITFCGMEETEFLDLTGGFGKKGRPLIVFLRAREGKGRICM